MEMKKPEARRPASPALFFAALIFVRAIGSLAIRVRYACSFHVGRGLAGGGNILGVCDLHDVLGALDLIRSVAVDGKQDAAVLDASFVALGFVFRNTHSDQSAGETTDRAADAETCERRHDRASRDERAYAGNCKRANSGE